VIDLKTLPEKPGVYIYRDKLGKIIYVGKAINLKKRVSQYFQRDDALGPKTKTLVSQIASVGTKIVGSEIEALILESSLIKKHLPKYNSQLRDDKAYIYICITKEKIPRIFASHLSKLKEKSHTYGPFPNGSAVQSLLKTIRHTFPYRSQEKHPAGDCLYCHLGLCPGFIPDRSYKKTIQKIQKLLTGKFTFLQRQLTRELKIASKSEKFESAIIIKKQLDSINYIVSGWHNLSTLFDSVELPEDRTSQAILELETVLKNILKKPINRIECFDISQLGNKYFVGSMVVWQNGKIDNSQYRQFKIRNHQDKPNDQMMIKEVVYRRLKHPEWPMPDLIVVDGGKPQVSAIVGTHHDAFLPNIPVIGLAKKYETIVIKNGNEWQEINLPANSSALHLLESLRDEAHRFANQYRRSLISRTIPS
jgi:excinuclease ABC subunit C